MATTTTVHHTPTNPNVRAADYYNTREELGQNVRHVKYERLNTGRQEEARANVIKKYPILLKDYAEQGKQQSRAPDPNLSKDIRSGALAGDIRQARTNITFTRPPSKDDRAGTTTRRPVNTPKTEVANGWDSPSTKRFNPAGIFDTQFLDRETAESKTRERQYFKRYSEERRQAAGADSILSKRLHAQKAGVFRGLVSVERGGQAMFNVERGIRKEWQEKPAKAAVSLGVGLVGGTIFKVGSRLWKLSKLPKILPSSAIKWALPSAYAGVKGGEYAVLPKGERSIQFGRDLGSEFLPFLVGERVSNKLITPSRLDLLENKVVTAGTKIRDITQAGGEIVGKFPRIHGKKAQGQLTIQRTIQKPKLEVWIRLRGGRWNQKPRTKLGVLNTGLNRQRALTKSSPSEDVDAMRTADIVYRNKVLGKGKSDFKAVQSQIPETLPVLKGKSALIQSQALRPAQIATQTALPIQLANPVSLNKNLQNSLSTALPAQLSGGKAAQLSLTNQRGKTKLQQNQKQKGKQAGIFSFRLPQAQARASGTRALPRMPSPLQPSNARIVGGKPTPQRGRRATNIGGFSFSLQTPKSGDVKKATKGRGFKTAYNPSVTALAFNVKGISIPKFNVKSGLGIRPILK